MRQTDPASPSALHSNKSWMHRESSQLLPFSSQVVKGSLSCLYRSGVSTILYLVLVQDKEAIKKHAELSGFPATHIEEIKTQISPITAS